MLNSNSYKVLKVQDLRLFCKLVGLKVSRLNKLELFDNYNKFLASKIIQKKFRQHFYKNAEDPILLEKVSYPCFIYRTKHGNCLFYNYDSIIRYIMKTGDCRDPITRADFTDEDLSRLDNSVKFHFPDTRYSSTLKIKKNINYARRIRNRENEILSYQTQLEELRNKLLILIESDLVSLNFNEPIVIESIQYSTINDYLNGLLHNLKLLFINLKTYDSFSAQIFKESIIDQIKNSTKIYEFISML